MDSVIAPRDPANDNATRAPLQDRVADNTAIP